MSEKERNRLQPMWTPSQSEPPQARGEIAGSRTAGRSQKLLGIALVILSAIVYGMSGGADSENPISFFLVLLLGLGGLLLHFRGRKIAAKARLESTVSPLSQHGNTVLYLRSFQSDTSSSFKVLMSGLTSEEEQLADVLRPIGELITVGRPGEKLPLPGAARMYASDSEWQSVVLEHMRSARLVILRAGASHGLFWELNESLTELTPDKFLILILSMKASDYRSFAVEARNNFGLELPPLSANSIWKGMVDLREPSRVQSGFLRFDANWAPEFLPIPFKVVRIGYNDLRGPMNQALQPVFAGQGVRWRPTARFS
jgi:hypothetical protein